jgi:hypothetical protein
MGFISWIIVGLLAGWLTGKIMGGLARAHSWTSSSAFSEPWSVDSS